MKRNDSNITFAILIFFATFAIINYYKPGIMFNEYGQPRQFGVGYKHKTILPIWLCSILLGIVCYLAVLWVSQLYI